MHLDESGVWRPLAGIWGLLPVLLYLIFLVVRYFDSLENQAVSAETVKRPRGAAGCVEFVQVLLVGPVLPL